MDQGMSETFCGSLTVMVAVAGSENGSNQPTIHPQKCAQKTQRRGCILLAHLLWPQKNSFQGVTSEYFQSNNFVSKVQVFKICLYFFHSKDINESNFSQHFKNSYMLVTNDCNRNLKSWNCDYPNLNGSLTKRSLSGQIQKKSSGVITK